MNKLNVKFLSGNSKELYQNIDAINNGSFIWCDDTNRFYLKFNDELSAITSARKPTSNHCKDCGAPLPMPEKYCAFVKCSYCNCIQDIDIW